MGPIRAGFTVLLNAFAQFRVHAQQVQANMTGAAANHAGQADVLRRDSVKKAARELVSKRRGNKNPLLDGLVRVGEVAQKHDNDQFNEKKMRVHRYGDDSDETTAT